MKILPEVSRQSKGDGFAPIAKYWQHSESVSCPCCDLPCSVKEGYNNNEPKSEFPILFYSSFVISL